MILKLTRAKAVYFSPTHTTEKAVTSFAEGTGLPFDKVDLSTPVSRKTSKLKFKSDELAIVGLPVYGGRLPKYINDFFTCLSGNGAPAVAVAMYGNREYEDALLELKMKLEERGFNVMAAAALLGEHSLSSRIATGRPDSSDLAIVKAFGEKAVHSISSNAAGKLTVPGSFPFVAKGTEPKYLPTTTDACTNCGLCAQNCPYGAINFSHYSVVDAAKCMWCGRCIKDCPAGAKQFADPAFIAWLPGFEARLNAVRKEPELFLPK